MIPKLIQRQGAQHLAEEEAEAPAGESLSAPPHLLELIPESVARENLVFPLSLDGEVLTCAVADPNNILLADKLSFILNKKVRFRALPAAVIRAAINRHYSRTKTESLAYMAACDGALFSDKRLSFGDELAEQQAQGGVLRRTAQAVANLPRSLGKTLVEFKKGAKGVEDRLDAMPARRDDLADHELERSLMETVRLPGEDTTRDYGTETMWYYTVVEGQRTLMVRRDGQMEVIVGPRRVWKGSNRFEPMRHFVAHPGEFLIVRFRDGRQEHLTGPADLWFDPRVHETVTRQEALQLAAKEAVIVYSRAPGADAVSRRIVHGPTLFVPAPGEWLHTFAWHGSEGGSQGQRKVAKGLVFQKLWLMPDQMYHDVTDVRTADDAVLTIKLMMFFELLDIDRMLETTHDPIGDFINAATSDVVDFCGHRTFEEFKKNTGELNELATYRQLTVRAAQNGYRVNKVVYRGYGAPDRLQAMHDQAIEARTKLQLERATEEQAQGLEDFKLNAQMNRAVRRRTEQATEVQTELELAQRRQEADLRAKEAERTASREQRRRDAETEVEIRRQADERTRQHLAALKDMGVDLTAFLTQGRADRVIELRGKGVAPHLHLDNADGERNGA